MATARKAAEAPAEPEQRIEVDGDAVAEGPKPPGNLEFLRTAMLQAKKQIRSELGTELTEIRKSVDDLAAVVTESQNGAGVTLEEDALSDRLDQLVDHKLVAMFGLDASEAGQKTLAAQLASLGGVFTEVQAETNARLASLAARITDLASASGAPTQGPVDPGAPAILGALWRVMEDVTYVPKGGTYEGGSSGNYKFRRFDDVAKELGEAFRRHGIFVKPSVMGSDTERFEVTKEYRNGGKSIQNWTDTRVRVKYTFVSLVDGSEQSVSVVGEGRDLSDKSTSKAMTMALKTVLTQAFMLPSDAPDPDSERPGDEAPQHHPADQGQAYDDEPAVREQERREDRETRAAATKSDDPDAPENQPPEVRAANALKYASQPGTTKDQWGAIIRKATENDLMMVKFEDGDTLQAKLMALRSTLAP